MRHFRVTVLPMRVAIDEQFRQFMLYDASAIVDGDTWRYKIRGCADISKHSPSWRTRAYHHIHYHAHNSGTVVRFEPVHYEPRRRRKMSEKQLSFW